MSSLDGKIALITGAGSGLGQSHAALLSERGAHVIIQDRDGDGAETTAAMVHANGRKSHVMIGDVRDSRGFAQSAAEAIATLGPVDILVNNAGISSRQRTFEEIDDEILAEMFDINVKGAYVATRAVIAGMKERNEGRIINTASIYGMAGSENGSHYSGAKAALIGLTKAWAREFAPWNILVNAVAPGFIPTPMTKRPGHEERSAERAKTIPLGREGDPLDISHVVAYFAGEEGKYVTGQMLSPNGGVVI
ncbi:MAG: SDR family oxidoreductase [Rhodospirillaceae bacterium]|jgi:3-oxoacyl-[acyl-carrier protein] reductase|nr:SDR family oxidoreductase [Rhodospirillaceae bacterium]MBT5457882.1 SDR family oxidoreductase [Rhodospirillaceae bacterium]